MTSRRLTGLFILGLLLVSCTRKAPHIEFVFPDKFRGVFVFDGESPDGSVIVASNNTLSLVVPASGTLRIAGKLPTHEWHSISARYLHGDSIPVYEPSAQISNQTVALRTIGGKGNTEDWFVVGTYSDASEAQTRLNKSKP
jgi:hypothetical protein